MTTQHEIEQLTEAMKNTQSTRMYERYLAVRLHLEGRTLSEISAILGRSFPAISGHWKSYREQGLQGLEFKNYPGGLKKLTPAQEEQLKTMITEKKPVDVGFEAKFTWTLQLICTWIHREFSQTYTLKGASKWLNRLGFSYTKATYTLARADVEEQQQFQDVTLSELKDQLDRGDIDHLLFEDESSIRAYMALQYNWFPKGQQREIPTYGQHQGAKLFAAINYETGYVTHREEELDAQAFERFLKDILKTYTGNLVIVLDNARVHHAKAIQPFLRKNPRLQFVYLPKYSPELNPVEGLWKWLKHDVVNNVFFQKFYVIRSHVTKFMNHINRVPQIIIDRLLLQV
ncbi:transposase-like protein [Paenibacillus terrae HPL-003]|uniref:Transposase-like protein n=1 Tax=Paenibacillus terrae (strain HPL-003) TaxID=985665 RepID=G7W2A3_PAETH|nr:IS630 family transposase [Paenibacillus terrae]AET59687.1 transposase-like protein [Paenibacillus terrae HPL-003]